MTNRAVIVISETDGYDARYRMKAMLVPAGVTKEQAAIEAKRQHDLFLAKRRGNKVPQDIVFIEEIVRRLEARGYERIDFSEYAIKF